MEICKVDHFTQICNTGVIHKSNSITGATQFCYYLLNENVPQHTFVNSQTYKFYICYFLKFLFI
jgi:hypothetical protein